MGFPTPIESPEGATADRSAEGCCRPFGASRGWWWIPYLGLTPQALCCRPFGAEIRANLPQRVCKNMSPKDRTPRGHDLTLLQELQERLVERRLPKHRPPTHPGEMLLAEFLKPLGVSQSAFAIRLGVSFPRLNEIIRGKRSVTPDTALRLARVLGMSADFWLGLQQDWDLWHALRSKEAIEIEQLVPLRRRA